MSDYEQKYLKYKNKYLTLKKQLDEQSGGNLYQAGYYVFFCSKSYDKDYILREYENKSFNDFTNSLGPCAMYFRIKSNEIKIDKLNDFETVYPNVSTVTSVATNLFKGVTTLTQKIGEGAKIVGQKVGESASYLQEQLNKNQTKVGQSTDNNNEERKSEFEEKNPMNSVGKGGALCPGKPFKSENLKGGLNYNQVNLDIVEKIVKEIENNNPQILDINSIYIVANTRNVFKNDLGTTSIRQVWNKDDYKIFNEIYKNTNY